MSIYQNKEGMRKKCKEGTRQNCDQTCPRGFYFLFESVIYMYKTQFTRMLYYFTNHMYAGIRQMMSKYVVHIIWQSNSEVLNQQFPGRRMFWMKKSCIHYFPYNICCLKRHNLPVILED